MDTVLYKTHQHFLIVVERYFSAFLPFALAIVLFGTYNFDVPHLTQVFIILVGGIAIFAWHYFFWVSSYLIITNEKVELKIQTGLFTKQHMSIFYKNIRDKAFFQGRFLHSMFDYGNLVLLSDKGSTGDIQAESFPNIAQNYRTIELLSQMSEKQRKALMSIEDLEA